MRFYNNLYGAYNSILKKIGLKDTEDTSIVLVFLSQGLHFFLTLGLIREIFDIDLVYQFPSKYYYLILAVPWLVLVEIYYYPKHRRETILRNFSEKSIKGKNIWRIAAVLTILIPFIIFPFLFA